MSYITKQQQAVLRCLEQRQGESLTAAELAQALREEGCPVGLATIYRQLEKLTCAGQVHKINTAEGAFFHLCDHAGGPRDCVLLKCSSCGRIRHLDCSHLQALYDHLEQEHHFRIDPRGTVFTGLCEVCAAKEDANGTK
ncbi:Fur family transcriptional regulator [uncultured Oscillibacter sp.]|uniref:Fur family transcriptional regulator n=1 Tax=uncultured Oscillibacter sp. TaxID=876091 RepID=UPI0025FF3704|nr:transcriptional repressor [uncultured Oscillibacter sp.]